VPHKLFKDMVLSGKRVRAEDALAFGVIDQISEPEKILEDALKLAKSVSKFGENRVNFKLLKEEMNRTAIKACYSRGLYPGIRVN
jgi:enoyl-CoA hydratase/carnithine racemase